MKADPRQGTLWAAYPAVPAARPTDTSMAAADSVADRAATIRDEVLDAIRRRGGLTADEAADAIERDILTVRPRVSELRALGAIEDSKERRANTSGRAAIVWRARPSERRA